MKPQDFKTQVHNNWCPGCVLPGTLIHTNPDVKPIEAIQEGHRVLGWDGRYHKVTEVFRHRHQGLMYKIRAQCLGETTLTPEHPVLMAQLQKGRIKLIWKCADLIRQDDYLAYPATSVNVEELGLQTDNENRFALVPIAGIETFEYDGPVWNLEVEDAHSYVSECATLHNCGDFGILNALQMALAEMNLEPHRVAVFSGIGCSGKTPHYINAYGVHTLHGRVLPYALGAKLAHPELTIVAAGGDGDGMGIGGGHFVNAGRRNVDITYILYNNGVYGLTKGQASPTLKLGVQTKSLPQPNINEGVNPLFLALAAGYTFIARGYAYDIKHLVGLIQQAVEHQGAAFVEVLQPCPTYNDINTKDWYGGEDRKAPQTGRAVPRVYRLEEKGYDPRIHPGLSGEAVHEVLAQFIRKALEWGDRIPIGVLLQNETVSSYAERITERISFYLQAPPARRVIADEANRPSVDLSPLLKELKVT
jgi:2-oxoglutarate ferredoxin oxidoreductase subunit beta